jgi:hypothetical protein
MARKTDATFKVKKVHIDGTNEGTLTILAPVLSETVFVSYRPKGARREYKLPIQMVCEMVASRAAKMGTIYQTVNVRVKE